MKTLKQNCSDCTSPLTLYLLIFAWDLNEKSYGEDKAHTESPVPISSIFLFTVGHLTDFHVEKKLQLNQGGSGVAVNTCVWVGMYKREVTSFILYINDEMYPNNFCI